MKAIIGESCFAYFLSEAAGDFQSIRGINLAVDAESFGPVGVRAETPEEVMDVRQGRSRSNDRSS